MARRAKSKAAGGGQEALLDYAVSHSPAVFYIADLKGQRPVRFISGNVEQVTGHPASAFLDSATFGRELMHPDDLAPYQKLVERLPQIGIGRIEYRFRSASGQYLWVRDELRLLQDESNGFVGCMLDITPEKAAEAQLEESNALVRTLMGHAMDAVIAMDEDGLVVEFNPAAEKMFGWSRAEAMGRPLGELIVPPALRDRHAEGLARLRGSGRNAELQNRRLQVQAQRRDGSLLPVELTIARALLGERVLYLGEVRDISDRVQALAERDLLHQRLRLAIAALPAGFSMTDSSERIVLCNEAFAAPYGRTPAEMIGMTRRQSIELVLPWLASLDGEPVGRDAAARDRVIARLREANLRPVELGTTDGRVMLVHSTRSPEGVVVSVRTDITPIKRAEAALAQSNAIIRQVLDACPVPVGMTRAEDGTVIYESRAAQALYGRPAGRPSKTTGNFVVPSDRARYLSQLRREGSVEGFEVRMRRGDGSEFLAALSARLFPFQGEDVIVSSTFDLTALKEAEAEQARHQEALHLSEKQAALGVLLAGVAHELNNPLSVVVGQALLLEETAADPAIRRRAEKIGQAADRCARIVKAFLALARERPQRSEPVAAAEIAAQALEVTGYLLRASDIAVRLRLPDALPRVLGDADQLVQVLANLIINAAQALQQRPSGRRLTITARIGRRDTLRLKVKDNGPGVAPDLQRRIFEPFFTTKAPGEGTGIGLALCHRVVAAHGGLLSLESNPGEGATFIITLPLAEGLPAPAPAVAAPPASHQALVIDDEAAVAETLAQLLQSEGVTATVALSGEAALSLLRRQDFDLILSDLRMPGLGGERLHDLLAKERPELLPRLAFVTGDTMSRDARRFLDKAGRPALEKPVGRAELVGLLGQLEARPAN